MPDTQPAVRRVLLLGAGGHLGSGLARGLLAAGFAVHGLARAPSPLQNSLPGVTWHFGDLRTMTTAAAWRSAVDGTTVIVNAAGALQDGLRDDLAAVHAAAIAALCEAAAPGTLFVQISAPGVAADASTAFYRSKAAGDAAVRASCLPWVILRPCLVVSTEAYGGSALLRALAAFPVVVPVVNPASRMRTVSLVEVVAAVTEAAEGRIAPGADLVLGETEAQSLAEVLQQFRAWLGLCPARVVPVPGIIGKAVSTLADAAGWLGWRSPLRSTALRVAAEGVGEAPSRPCRPLAATLADMAATVQERWFARLYLMKAASLVLLALFWMASGAIGFARLPEAAAVLTRAGMGPTIAGLSVIGGSLADVTLGTLVLVRRWSARALGGMIVMTIIYLAAASIVTPGLWLDPLGPLVKSIPAAMLALFSLAIDPER